jgi:hypothetical protein
LILPEQQHVVVFIHILTVNQQGAGFAAEGFEAERLVEAAGG